MAQRHCSIYIISPIRFHSFTWGFAPMKKHKLESGFRRRNRKMFVEQLEGRALLAGDVTVSVVAGNMFVTGDNHDNLVLIENPAPGVYDVTGFDFADTTISAG